MNVYVHTHVHIVDPFSLLIQYGNNYLTFDIVSLVPYDRKLIDTSILSPQQVNDSVSLQVASPRVLDCFCNRAPIQGSDRMQ